jgi:hypothetical protein
MDTIKVQVVTPAKEISQSFVVDMQWEKGLHDALCDHVDCCPSSCPDCLLASGKDVMGHKITVTKTIPGSTEMREFIVPYLKDCTKICDLMSCPGVECPDCIIFHLYGKEE